MMAPRVPPMLSTIVQAGLLAVDGVSFGDCAACPDCGGPVSGYDTRKKIFCIIRENERERTLHVNVKRFSCKHCGSIVNADEPFYPGTRIGSPVVDLCLTLATMMTVNRTAAWLDALDIIVDRTSCRKFTKVFPGPVPATPLFGTRIPLSVISLSTLAAGAGGERGAVSGAEILAACGFPSAHRAALFRPLRKERDERDPEEEKEERQVQDP
ncbi:hypothetical protein [Methanoregula sp.]|uniref:hypothetical protein n=1 Tax=Methanoregula sp. TaxID=2052170 RepID=UPI002C4B2076|nr:hypothetical protein [Methanoregula sp.]HVP97449.1 hypothetical protein [Methanoregula sp.]